MESVGADMESGRADMESAPTVWDIISTMAWKCLDMIIYSCNLVSVKNFELIYKFHFIHNHSLTSPLISFGSSVSRSFSNVRI